MHNIAANPGSSWLIAGGGLSVAAALLHIACIFGGPDWYRFFGAGEGIARAAARGDWAPTVITLVISAILLIWAAYAFSGAGSLPRLPLLRTGLVVITAIYLLRGLIFCAASSVAPAAHRQLRDLVVADRVPLRSGLCHRDDQGLAPSCALNRTRGDGGESRG